MKLPKIKYLVRVKLEYNLFFGVTERKVGKKGDKKGKGIVGKFSLRIVCQNHIPFSLVILRIDLRTAYPLP